MGKLGQPIVINQRGRGMNQIPTAYEQANAVEARGKARLKAWLDVVSHEGQWVWIAKSGLAQILQKLAGDTMIGVGPFESLVLEWKFLENSADAPFEVYSNRVLLPDGTPDRTASTPGWGMTCKADLIGIYNLSGDTGIVGRLAEWKAMLNEKLPSGLRRWQLYDRREQTKRVQRNSSWVIWTPYSELISKCGFVRFSARQLELDPDPVNPIRQAFRKADHG